LGQEKTSLGIAFFREKEGKKERTINNESGKMFGQQAL